ncbi:hypothetical protein [Streptomyces sp. NPDC059378]|uniref:hypothetical protein n=1 Tax=Streptomyces sp. NPDC059378 TaxID=3346815 RepID=UPI003679F7C3
MAPPAGAFSAVVALPVAGGAAAPTDTTAAETARTASFRVTRRRIRTSSEWTVRAA